MNTITNRMRIIQVKKLNTVEHIDNGLTIRYRIDQYPFPMEYASCGSADENISEFGELSVETFSDCR